MDQRLSEAEAVVFDIGNVLLRFDPRQVCGRLPEDRREALYQALFGPEGHWPEFDLAAESNEVISRKAAAQAGNEAWWTDVLDAYLHFHERMEVLPLSREIAVLRAQGKKVCLLTNYGEPAFSLAWERFGFLRETDGAVVSAREKKVKPDPEIFLRLIRRFGLIPEKTLFVDDSEKNTDAAARLGFRVWHYETPEAGHPEGHPDHTEHHARTAQTGRKECS